jgi:hypothetical protein
MVEKINLNGSGIDCVGAAALAKALDKNSTITEINLNTNNYF